MTIYYVNKNAQPTGEHEVHKTDCSNPAEEENRQYLGSFDNCQEAVKEAKKYFDNVDGCYWCSRACNTR